MAWRSGGAGLGGVAAGGWPRAARTPERAARAGEPSAPASRPAPAPRAGARVSHEPGGGWVRHEPRAEHRYPQTLRRQPQVLTAWRTRLRPRPRSRRSRAAQRTPFRSSLWPRAHARRTSAGRAGELPRRWPRARRGARSGLVQARAVRRDSAPRSAHCGPAAARLRSRPSCPRTATCARAGPCASDVACPPPAASLPVRAAESSSAGRRLRRSQGHGPAESARPPPRSSGHKGHRLDRDGRRDAAGCVEALERAGSRLGTRIPRRARAFRRRRAQTRERGAARSRPTGRPAIPQSVYAVHRTFTS